MGSTPLGALQRVAAVWEAAGSALQSQEAAWTVCAQRDGAGAPQVRE